MTRRRMSASRVKLCLALLVVPFLLAACKASPKDEALAERRGEVHAILADASDAHELSKRVGALPERCIEVTVATRLCPWRLGNRHSGWQRLTRAIGTRARLNLLCELPADVAPRRAGSCRALLGA